MSKKAEQPQNFSMEEAKKLAQSEAGQKLYSALQQSHGAQLRSAMEQASAGNYTEVKKALSELLNDPNIRDMMQKIGGSSDG